jgi:hypothetical protein
LQHFCGFCNSAKKSVNHLIKFRRIIKVPCNNFSVCLQIKFRASRMIYHCTTIDSHLMTPFYILCTGQGNSVTFIRFEETCLWFSWKNTIKTESVKHFTENLIWNCTNCAAAANTTDVTQTFVIEFSFEVELACRCYSYNDRCDSKRLSQTCLLR